MLEPIGFWSYGRLDDENSDGRLSALRKLVGNEINLRCGKRATLWQDVAAIPHGANWQAEIDRAIAQTTFYIPVITPRYLQSEHCYREYLAFRHHMRAMGRDDLIFPIHYVSIDRLDPEKTVFADDMDLLLASHWSDFRPLIYEDIETPSVRKWAGALAESVVGAMMHDRVRDVPSTRKTDLSWQAPIKQTAPDIGAVAGHNEPLGYPVEGPGLQKSRALRVISWLAVIAALGGLAAIGVPHLLPRSSLCDSDTRAKILSSSDIPAIRSFIDACPTVARAIGLPGKLEELVRKSAQNDAAEKATWEKFSAAGMLADIEAYMRDFPNGKFYDQAKNLLSPIATRVEIPLSPLDKAPLAGNRMGVDLAENNKEWAKLLNLPTESGVLVLGVEPGSLGGKAGLRAGDVLDTLNNVPVSKLQDVWKTVFAAEVGSTVAAEVLRPYARVRGYAEWLVKKGREGDTGAVVVQAYERLNRGRSKEAFELLITVADKNTRAQRTLGYMYLNGVGVNKDDKQSFEWYKKAAEAGDDIAQANLSWFYQAGVGTHPNLIEALHWARQALQKQSPIAFNNMGWLYEEGKTVKQDYAAAMPLYQSAAQQDNARAQRNLGNLYYYARGVSKDVEKALYWYRKSAEQGWADSQFSMGWLYFDGAQVKKDHTVALTWLQKAAAQGHADAANHIGLIYELGEGVSKDESLALEWYQTAAKLGDEWGAHNLGLMYYRARKFDLAFEWFGKAADKGNASAANYIGIMYRDGDLGKVNIDLAIAQFETAAKADYVIAMRNLGRVYEYLKRDQETAIGWYRKAAERGDETSKVALRRLDRANQ